MFRIWFSAGAALAAEQPAQESVLPQLPSPPEIVQSLSQTLLGDSPSDSPSAEAPPLKDDDSASGKPSENGNGKDAAKNGNGDGKSKGVSAEDAIKDQELETRFKSQILPKIQEQLKGLDQNEKPNAATIELKRQLRVGLSTLHPPPRTTVHVSTDIFSCCRSQPDDHSVDRCHRLALGRQLGGGMQGEQGKLRQMFLLAVC